jgi:uncharacterized protein YqgC (DUF456 family)
VVVVGDVVELVVVVVLVSVGEVVVDVVLVVEDSVEVVVVVEVVSVEVVVVDSVTQSHTSKQRGDNSQT